MTTVAILPISNASGEKSYSAISGDKQSVGKTAGQALEVIMLSCHICGSDKFTEELVNETFEIKGKLILVEGIPAKVCSRCGEVTFSNETAENIRLMLNSNQKSQRKIEIDVFAFSA